MFMSIQKIMNNIKLKCSLWSNKELNFKQNIILNKFYTWVYTQVIHIQYILFIKKKIKRRQN